MDMWCRGLKILVSFFCWFEKCSIVGGLVTSVGLGCFVNLQGWWVVSGLFAGTTPQFSSGRGLGKSSELLRGVKP